MEKRDDKDLRLEVKRVRRMRTSVKAGICSPVTTQGCTRVTVNEDDTCSPCTTDTQSGNTNACPWWTNHNARKVW